MIQRHMLWHPLPKSGKKDFRLHFIINFKNVTIFRNYYTFSLQLPIGYVQNVCRKDLFPKIQITLTVVLNIK